MSGEQNLDHLEALATIRKFWRGYCWQAVTREECAKIETAFAALARRAAPVPAPVAGDALETLVREYGNTPLLGDGRTRHVVMAEIRALANQPAPITGDVLAGIQRYDLFAPAEGDADMHEADEGSWVEWNAVKAVIGNQPAPTAGDALWAAWDKHSECKTFDIHAENHFAAGYRAALANQPAPTAAPEQVAPLDDMDLRDPWVVAARKAEHLCPAGLSSPDRWRWKAAYMWGQLADNPQPSETAPLETAKAGIEQAYKACQQVSAGFDHDSGERLGARACIAAVKELYLAAPSLPAAAPNTSARDAALEEAARHFEQDVFDPAKVAMVISEIRALKARPAADALAHQPAQEQADTASQVDPSMALPSRRLA